MMPRGRAIATLVVADDHPLVRHLLQTALAERPDLKVVGEAATGPEALEITRRMEPDLLVLDLGLPGLEGVEVARRLRRAKVPTKILVLTARDDPRSVFEAVRAGVDGYIEKTATAERITEEIDALLEGKEVFTPEQDRSAAQVLGELARSARGSAGARALLTRRQRGVLQLLAEGAATREIGSRLEISEGTVRRHLTGIYEALGVRTRVQAVMRGVELGLIRLEDPEP